MLTESIQPYYFILTLFRAKFFLRKCLSNRTTGFYGAEVFFRKILFNKKRLVKTG
jgi:hypothetical protein